MLNPLIDQLEQMNDNLVQLIITLARAESKMDKAMARIESALWELAGDGDNE